MKKLLTIILGGLTSLGGSYSLSAQCPNTVTISTTNNVAANCPSSGSILVTSNAAEGSLNYILTAGPTGGPINIPQDDSNFISLPAGVYTVKAFCKADPSKTDSKTFTIADGYTPFVSSSVAATTSCNNNGSITISSVTGGKLPLMYAISTLAASPAGFGTFQSGSSFTSLAAGMYIVQIKDACGQYINKQIEVAPPLLAPKLLVQVFNNQPCANNTFRIMIYGAVNPATGMSVDLQTYYNAGFILNGYEVMGDCQKGALLATYNSNTSGGSPYFVAPKRDKYYVEVITSCGLTYGYCTSDEGYIIPAPFIELSVSSGGCGTSGSPATMNLYSSYAWLTRWNEGIIFSIKNSAGIPIAGSPFTFTSTAQLKATLINLPHDAYSINATDACGQVLYNYTIPDITLSGTPQATVINSYTDCQTQIGTMAFTARINGYVPNLANADSLVIISGPSNVGVHGLSNDPAVASWTNMLPGSYVIRAYTSCGNTDVPWTISNNQPFLKRHLSAKASSFCSGNGRVEVDSTSYNGSGTITYVLKNLTNNARVDSNLTGSFTNLLSGDYQLIMKITDYCSATPGSSYEVISNTVSVLQNSTTPQIIKKLAMTCEDAGGDPLATGTIYLNLAGPSPLLLQYVDSSSATPVWITATTNASSSETISGLNASHTYYVRISGCTGGSSQQVTFGKMSPINVLNTLQPCINSDYTLSVPELPGATYQWKNALNTVVSNVYNYDIINYNASYDGIYTCTVSFSGCVTRVVSVNLNSQTCGIPLPLKLTSFTAVNKDCKAELTWTAVYSSTDRDFTVERSSDGKYYTSITTIPVKTAANAQYNYTDITEDINNSNLYYRLKMTDKDGSAIYSLAEIVKACNNNQYTSSAFTLSPNPVANGHTVTLTYQGNLINGSYNILNAAGQSVMNNIVSVGGNAGTTVQIPLQGLTPGVYMIVLTSNDHKMIGRGKLVVYK